MKLLKGAPVCATIYERLTPMLNHCATLGKTPALAIIRVGDKPDDVSYENSLVSACGKHGVTVVRRPLPVDATDQLLDDVVATLINHDGDDASNTNGHVDGVLVLRPLPKHINDGKIRNRLHPSLDVDGISNAQLSNIFTNSTSGATAIAFAPCTAQACVEILEHYGIGVAGKRVAIVGRSLTVGKPLAMLLLNKNATVTICHSQTTDLAGECRRADIVVACLGKPKFLTAEYFCPGQTVIDVGIHVLPSGTICGDVDLAVSEIVGAITPVPSGVGSVTTAVLIEHVVRASASRASL
ncbi:MAG: bifunctional 5,10-methylenetetrahydrofolate dehydrogenase/5,10-methenyltetrahydrofolate cyclohydrolase [Clostridiales bacterium]|jgi:methylenetetrahydrofolate dehydrogenase (NADP+)/methenyltetrahydrofolate cyclohydrolase|nr:bifunctional 5,10-methylenetetrahydrofolate dehydrogenase/5,10-methenyltetrahydrofolate cyclohydrolase [Clostridiales bacterium]